MSEVSFLFLSFSQFSYIITLHIPPFLSVSFQESVPHIALIGSGGGQRAAVGLMGSLYQLEKEGLLDTLLYLGGVSGSTW